MSRGNKSGWAGVRGWSSPVPARLGPCHLCPPAQPVSQPVHPAPATHAEEAWGLAPATRLAEPVQRDKQLSVLSPRRLAAHGVPRGQEVSGPGPARAPRLSCFQEGSLPLHAHYFSHFLPLLEIIPPPPRFEFFLPQRG